MSLKNDDLSFIYYAVRSIYWYSLYYLSILEMCSEIRLIKMERFLISSFFLSFNNSIVPHWAIFWLHEVTPNMNVPHQKLCITWYALIWAQTTRITASTTKDFQKPLPLLLPHPTFTTASRVMLWFTSFRRYFFEISWCPQKFCSSFVDIERNIFSYKRKLYFLYFSQLYKLSWNSAVLIFSLHQLYSLCRN